MSDTEQQRLDLFRELNRYDDRNEDWPSDAVFAAPRRTLANGWQKFHAARDCGARNVVYVENTTTRLHGDHGRYDYRLRCWACGHQVPEEEVLFIGGDWFSKRGWEHYENSIDQLTLPEDRVLELGPDPDRDALVDALELTRIEWAAGPHLGGPLRPEQWRECDDCGHEVPLRFDDRCRMCYDGEWTDRMQDSPRAFERKVREWHNHSFVHRLAQHVDPLHPGSSPMPGTMLWRRHDAETTSKLVEVTARLEDVDDGHREYVLMDPTHTCRWQYREADLADCFWDTNLRNDGHEKPVQDDRIRAVFQRVCDHSFSVVHDPETQAPVGEQCLDCRVRRPLASEREDAG